MIRILAGIEGDAHRDALHYLHVVAGGVFRRQKTEFRAAGSGDTLDGAGVIAAVGVDRKLHLLTHAHFLELGLLEIRGDP